MVKRYVGRAFARVSKGILGLVVLGSLGSGMAAGCSDPTRAGVAHGCALNSDCDPALICILGRCHAQCKETRDCPTGERCIVVGGASVCQQGTEASCASCPSPLVCASDGLCRSACTTGASCPANQVCATQGVCAEPTEVNSKGALTAGADAGTVNGGSGGRSGTGGASHRDASSGGAGGRSTGGAGGAGTGGMSSGGASPGGSGGTVSTGGADAAVVDAGPKCSGAKPDRCGATCTDLASDLANCSACGTPCAFAHAGASCAAGVCTRLACDAGYGDCKNGDADGCETNVLGSDANNCGACNAPCLVGQVCTAGACKDNIVTCASTGITCAQATCFTNTNAISVGGGIVVDVAKGRRLWTRATRALAAEAAAEADCASLVLEGISGWRLPTSFAELGQTLLYPGGLQGCPTCAPAIDQAAFPDTRLGDDYLTSHFNTGRGGYDTVEFCDGRNNYQAAGSVYRCTHDPL